MKIGIIIVTYNSQKDIARLLESIIIQQYEDFVIYLVDNGSNDQTLNIVQKYLTKTSICIIPTMINNGFARGNNIGIKRAMDEGCDFLFIINPDMQLEDKCIDVLIDRILSDEKIGMIGPVVLDGHKIGNFIQSYGFKVNFKTQFKEILFTGKELTNEIPSEIYVDYALGGVMMIRSSVLKTTGLFEEDYFMYNDELDIAYRIKNADYKTLCVRNAIARHFHNTDKKNKSGYNLMYYYMMRNKFLYFKKFRLYPNIIFSLIKEIVIFPLKIRWAIQRMGNIKLLKYYYSGLIDGLSGKKGISNRLFN